MNHVLIVDDEAEIRESLEGILAEEGYSVASAGTAGEALTLIGDADYDVVLLDVWLPDRDGLEVLADVRRMDPERMPEVVIISGHGTIEAAVRATKLGAYDFLEKPLSLERTLLVLQHAMDARRLRQDNRELVRQMNLRGTVTGMSVAIKALRQQIKLMAPTNGRVLIYGESGTGKELIARTMHAESLRRERVFVELNCAAIPEDHIETELFGFRGGPQEKRGTFERADGGTLFLDEVGDMSLKTQAKVLRALDEQRFLPVGATHAVHVDARVIAATNKDLEEEIGRGNFREDLFYRLNVIPFFVPPLRERKEDIPLLVKEFLQEFGTQYGRPHVEMGTEALAALREYAWPGNVRELRNLVERVLILNPRAQRIERKHLPVLVSRDGGARDGRVRGEEFSSLQEAREAYEREYIVKKVDECHGNISRAAEALGLERSHLYRKMKALGVSVKE
ncbi:MAG: sigma-54 dependent transcriptional regulator [Acidobacteriota bacterium]|nr:sigma-54 dependent transcriptional regulator [Acidobacteriota bacterium]